MTTDRSRPTSLLLPAINDMIDITATRAHGRADACAPDDLSHAGFAGACQCGALGGLRHVYQEKPGIGSTHLLTRRSVTLAIYVVLDYEYPQFGLIRMQGF